ncbi:uncharacterized protein LOC117109574 [Anneissia japonica]|uniref:uncharacterized protein LOC117109574 n=1 Tax=Anneissia japonica TaxID=1529436 RepID=UPI001425814F|nr:uncharacterized protein LOC117109574 [Anneissia japonica]
MFSGEDGFFSNLFGSKPEKGVTKQRGKSKDRYHEDPPDIPGGYDSEEEIRISHTHHHHTHEEKSDGAKSTLQSIFKPSSDEQPHKKDKGDGLISNMLGTKEKGVTKQRGKSKDRYHGDPPHIPGGYDSEEEIKIRHTHHPPSKEKSGDAKTKLQGLGLFKSSSDKKPHRDNAYLAEHESQPNKSRAKGGGRETPKKSTFGTLFGSGNDAKSTKKKSQDRYHQKNPYEKYEKESKGGRGGSGGRKVEGGGWWSGGGGGGSSGEAKSGKSKGRSAGRQSKGGSSGFSLPSF